jgi:hypothetical protein
VRGELVEPTGLQVWCRVLFELLDAARDELDDASYEAFVDIALRRTSRELARLGQVELDDWRAAA